MYHGTSVNLTLLQEQYMDRGNGETIKGIKTHSVVKLFYQSSLLFYQSGLLVY